MQQDPYGNCLARFVFPEPVSELKIEVDLVADMTVYNPFDFFVEEIGRDLAVRVSARTSRDDLVDLPDARAGRARCSQAFLAGIDRTPDAAPSISSSSSTRGLQREIGYLIRHGAGVQTPEETLERGSGSCRDSGWLLVQVLRHLGFAARFVSGYLIQLKPDVALDGPPGTDHDFTDLHAWARSICPAPAGSASIRPRAC